MEIQLASVHPVPPSTMLSPSSSICTLSFDGRIHVLYAHRESWFPDHALEALHRMNGRNHRELAFRKFEEMNSISWLQTERTTYLSRDCDSAA